MKKALFLSLIFTLCAGAVFSDNSSRAGELIHHADTYLWLGMNERGDMKDYARGLELLDFAEDLLDKEVPQAERAQFLSEIASLRADLIEQTDMTHDTLGGIFPISRFIGTPVLLDPETYGTFEIVDDAYIIAHASAIENGLPLVNSVGTIKLQAGSIVFSNISDVALENETAYILNKNPSFYMHTKHELLELFSESDIESMRRGALSDQRRREIISELGDTHLLVVNFEQTDQIDDVYFYSAFFKVYEAETGALSKQFSTMGFARDRNPSLRYMLLTDLVLLVAAGLIYMLLNKRRLGRSDSSRGLFGAGLFLYVIGRVLPYIFTSLLSPLFPSPDTLAVLSFWWPLAAGLLILIGPSFLYFALSSRISNLSPALSFAGRGGTILLAIGLGAAGFMAAPVYIYEGISGFFRVIPQTLNIAASAYILGRVLDAKDEATRHFTPVSIIGMLIVAAIFSLENSLIYFTISGILFVVVAITTSRLLKDRDNDAAAESMEEATADYTSSTESMIFRLLQSGPADLVPMPVLDQAAEYLSNTGVTDRTILLTGPEGRGKTIYSRALAEKLAKSHFADTNPLILRGACPDTGEPESFGLFEKAFSGHNALSALINTDDRMERTAQSLEELAGSLLPIPLELLFPEGMEGPPKTTADIHHAIYVLIRRIAKKRGLILVLEDLQFIDPDSRELLLFLIQQSRGDDNFFIICNSENDDIFREVSASAESVFNIPLPETSVILNFLTGKMEIDKTSSEIILEAFKLQNGKFGEMGELNRMLTFFAREELFTRNEDHYLLKKAYRDPDSLPIQPDVYEEIRTRLEQYPQYEKVIGCAACLGREFLAETLTSSLQIPRLELLDILDNIEADTGFIYDIRENDDCFAFSSSHVFKAIREELEITESGPMQNDVPQIVREYHRRLAETMVRQWEKTNAQDLIPDIALHFYAAGVSNARRAWDFCIKTVRLSMEAYMFRQAFTYLEYAAECGKVLAEPAKKEIEVLGLYLRNAHLSGINRNTAAEKGWDYLEKHPETDNALKLDIARACYDSAVSGRREYFTKCFSAAEGVVNSGDTGRNRAEALQFLGLSAEPGDPRRREYLRDSLALLEAEEASTEILIVKARVLDSLGRDIMYDDPSRAEDCFIESLKLKELPEIADKPGCAISYGALGNLYHFVRKDLEKAVAYYEKDLEISIEINDLTGQTKMHSLIAGCCEGLEEYGRAGEEYTESYRICGEEGSPVDRFFASAGLMFCGLKAGTAPDELTTAAAGFTALLEEPGIAAMLQPNEQRKNFMRDRLVEIVGLMDGEPSLKQAVKKIRDSFSITTPGSGGGVT